MSFLPTSVLPVKDSFRTRGCSRTAAVMVLALRPGMTFTTPSGTPASCRMSATAKAVRGVRVAGLSTTAHPAARAGAILRVAMAAGKFHGVTR